MIGAFGCPCSKCLGGGTISLQLRSKLHAFERLLGAEIVVTMGYRCREEAARLKLPETEALHSTERDREGVSMAVDFFPRIVTYSLDKIDQDGKRWGNRRFDFLELTRPFFDAAWISTDPENHNKWSIHGEIKAEDVKQVTVPYGFVQGG